MYDNVIRISIVYYLQCGPTVNYIEVVNIIKNVLFFTKLFVFSSKIIYFSLLQVLGLFSSKSGDC